MKKLPTKLKKEPLIDAIFELRFNTTAPFSNIFPGFCFSNLEGAKTIESLPTAELSKFIRDNDPNLQFAPILKIHWKSNYLILVSDRSIALTCNIPYPGWDNFKQAILEIIELVAQLEIVDSIHRYALKYVDLIPTDKTQNQASYINFNVKLGSHKLNNENFHFRIEIPDNQIVNVIQIVSYGKATMSDGSIKEGVVIDIDTIYSAEGQIFSEFKHDVKDKLDHIHEVNKKTFFDCLTIETLRLLEPHYE